MITYIPCGPKNLLGLFPSADWANMQEYYIEVQVSEAVVATTTKYIIDDCKETDDVLRVHFLNQLGTIDAINLKNIGQVHEPSSSKYENSIPMTFSRQKHQIQRNNVTANDLFTGYMVIQEEDVDYFEELFDSPLAWLEWNNEYLPIVIEDTKFTKRKIEDRYEYETTIDFRYSKEKIIIRN